MADVAPTAGYPADDAVRAERARRRMTQAQLAERLGWAPSTLADLEGGRRQVRLDDLPLLCEALDVSLRKLLADAPAAEVAKPRI